VPIPYEAHFQGETKIVDAQGRVLARLGSEDGPGVVTADIDPRPVPPSEPVPDGQWIHIGSRSFSLAWNVAHQAFGLHGRQYYKRIKKSGVYSAPAKF
jgi:hypothetical protein